MKLPVPTAFVAAGCVLLASCYPFDESQRHQANQKAKDKTQQKTVTSPEQQKLQEQRDKLKSGEKLKKKVVSDDTTAAAEPDTGTTAGTTGTGETPKPPTDTKRTEVAVASKVLGKEGYVFSPFNNKLIDVRNIPSGTLVADPTYPASAKKHFRVP